MNTGNKKIIEKNNESRLDLLDLHVLVGIATRIVALHS